MNKDGDSRTTTTSRLGHRSLIDPTVLIILIPPILLLLFLFLLTYVPTPIKPTSLKSTFHLFILFLVLLASLFHILNHEEHEVSTNMVVENDQHQDIINGINDESDENSFYDAVNWPFWDESMDVAGNSDDERTSTPPPEPWIYVHYPKLDRSQVSEDSKRRTQRRKAKNIRRVAPYIPPAPPPPAPVSPPPKDQAPAPVPATTSTPFIKNLKKIFTPGNKNKKHPSSKISKPPLPPTHQPEPQLKDRNSSSSNTSHSSWTPPPAGSRLTPHPQPEPESEPQHYDRQSSMSSSSQSSYIPEPPPLPPFDIPANRYQYFGEYARLRSYNSNTSSSPDLQPMAGQPSTSRDSGDSFLYSPDVNTKADIFISKGKDKWKMEQEITIKKKGGTRFINKPRKSNLNSMKSHFDL